MIAYADCSSGTIRIQIPQIHFCINPSTCTFGSSNCQVSYLNWLKCLKCSALSLVPWWSSSVSPKNSTSSPPQEAAKAVVLVLQSIFWGSDGVKTTPSPVRKAIQESKQEKPKTDWTYCTGKSGLNLQTEKMEIMISTKKTFVSSLFSNFYLRFNYGPKGDCSFPLYKLINEVWSHAWGFQV